jgi:GTP-binding protein
VSPRAPDREASLVKRVEFAGAIGLPQQGPPGLLPQVAIAGRSNCGKSSLINALVNRKSLARVSQKPGKTREINFYDVNETLFLVDLPGYGFASAPAESRDRWPTLIGDFLKDNPRLEGVVLLLDCRRGVLDSDRQLLDVLALAGVPALYVLTKIDKLNRAARKTVRAAVMRDLQAPADQVLLTSARTREGLDELLESILALVEPDPLEAS